MGLTAGKQKCLNCKKYRFTEDDYHGKQVNTFEKRGDIQIEVTCQVCEAAMYFVIFTEKRLKPAIAYRHTCNDEPCYEKDCHLCYGKQAEKEDEQQ